MNRKILYDFNYNEGIKKPLSQIRSNLNSDNGFSLYSISCNSCGRGYYGGDGPRQLAPT